jgi:heat-inducible transcriptional repressor
MRNQALQERRNQQVLNDAVRIYIETGEPVSSRAVARRSAEMLSPATIRNIMADLEGEGFLYQPHTSAGRVPTPSAFRFYVRNVAGHASLTEDDREMIRRELASASTPEEVMERASHVLSVVSQGLGIIVSPPLSSTVLEHVRFLLLPDGRILVVLISSGGLTRDKTVRLEHSFTQDQLDRTAEFLNRFYAGCTLDDIRADLQRQVARETERYDRLLADAAMLCAPEVLGGDAPAQVFVEGAGQIAAAPEFTNQQQLRELLAAIEEKKKLVVLLARCIEAPEPVQVQIGVDELSDAGEHLALIAAPYTCHERVQGSLGVLGPMRMHYERAITAVAFVAKMCGKTLSEG